MKMKKKKRLEEKNKRKELLEKEWRNKVKAKHKKENEKKEKIEKQQQLSQRWAMLRWVTHFIRENQDNWENERKEKEK